jgi:hypothetical protein
MPVFSGYRFFLLVYVVTKPHIVSLPYSVHRLRGVPIGVWKYGDVKVEKIQPVFTFEARSKDRTRVFVNLCTSPKVPYNLSPDAPHKRSTPLTRKGQDLILLIGERGLSDTVEGAMVYDVVVHPELLVRCDMDSTGVLKEKVCAEVLRSIRRLGVDAEFTLFTLSSASAAAASNSNSTAGQRTSTAITPGQLKQSAAATVSSTDSGLYHARYLTAEDAAAAQSDEAAWRTEWRKNQPKDVSNPFADLTDLADVEYGDEGQLRVYIPMPSISAFFHMEQVQLYVL